MGRFNQMRAETLQILDLENRVFQHLHSLNYPALRKLSISADLGKVIVSGTVRSFYERQIAVNSVRQVAGVIKLTDNIIVPN